MAKLDWDKTNRIKALNKEEITPSFIKDKKSINAYMGISDTIKKIENKDWIKKRKTPSKQERYRNTLYRKLNRHIQELVEIDSAFKNTKLYEQALGVYNKDD